MFRQGPSWSYTKKGPGRRHRLPAIAIIKGRIVRGHRPAGTKLFRLFYAKLG